MELSQWGLGPYLMTDLNLKKKKKKNRLAPFFIYFFRFRKGKRGERKRISKSEVPEWNKIVRVDISWEKKNVTSPNNKEEKKRGRPGSKMTYQVNLLHFRDQPG